MSPEDRLIGGLILNYIGVFLYVLVICGISLMSHMPFLILGVIHRVVDCIEYGLELPVVISVHLYHHIDQRDFQVLAHGCQGCLCCLVFIQFLSGKILVDVVSVDECSSGFSHVIRYSRILFLECTDYAVGAYQADDDSEHQQQRHNGPCDIDRHIGTYLLNPAHTATCQQSRYNSSPVYHNMVLYCR